MVSYARALFSVEGGGVHSPRLRGNPAQPGPGRAFAVVDPARRPGKSPAPYKTSVSSKSPSISYQSLIVFCSI